MTAATPVRSPLKGVTQIIRFNWRMYAIGLATLAAMGLFLAVVRPIGLAAMTMFAGWIAALGWLTMSVVVSWLVYDLSSLCRWTWIKPLMPHTPRRIANIHAGFDESSAPLRLLFPHASLHVLDIFDPAEMTEPSIAVARAVPSALRAMPADFRHLPLGDGACDLVTLLLAAHELRSSEARVAFLREVRRCLADRGRVILAEHLRDLPNFLAFGPGFTHFHSRPTWLADAAAAGLTLVAEHRITPFVRIFVFERSNP
jgi:SAM-dependent methyltransferase